MEVDDVVTKTKKKRVPAKKRKADKPANAKRDVAVQKKPKRSLSDTDEQWQKYYRNKNAATATAAATKNQEKPKKAAVEEEAMDVGTNAMDVTSTTTTTTSSTTAGKKEQQQKKKKKTNPLLKHREPCDLMLNEKRVEEIERKIEKIDLISETNCEQKALAIHVMPARSRQTSETLALGMDKASHIVYNDVDFCMEMKRKNYERSANGENQVYSLQDMMGDQGFFSVNNEHVEQVVSCIRKNNRRDIEFAKISINENKKSGTATSKKSTQVTATAGDTSNKKLNCILGSSVYYSYGYNRRTPQLHYKKMVAQDLKDRAERFKEFYKDDPLEDETNYGEIADNFKMLREAKRQNMEKFLNRAEILKRSAALTPKTDLELVSAEYVKIFRHPPSEGEELCANRESCVFNTFSRDKNVCYIGKVFFTENERLRRLEKEKEKKKKTPHTEGEEEGGGGNTHRLCYDCLIQKWTTEWRQNIHEESFPERPINYFSLMCKPGQYHPKCMLTVNENDKPTGIVGYVPRFSLNHRYIGTLERHIKRDGKFHKISVPFLDETGMDF